jgi:hypothetical protein
MNKIRIRTVRIYGLVWERIAKGHYEVRKDGLWYLASKSPPDTKWRWWVKQGSRTLGSGHGDTLAEAMRDAAGAGGQQRSSQCKS